MAAATECRRQVVTRPLEVQDGWYTVAAEKYYLYKVIRIQRHWQKKKRYNLEEVHVVVT